MSNGTLRLVLGFVLAALVTTSIAFAATRNHDRGKGNDQNRFSAHLIGYNEVPSLNSSGVGDLTLTIGDNQMSFDLKYSGLSGPPAVAHVHVGQPGVSGKPACPAATSGEITGTVLPADIVGPVAQGFTAGDFNSVVKAIEAGFTYANMHTAQFPNGEIRGQLLSGHGDEQGDQD
jgi:hypothetical protein